MARNYYFFLCSLKCQIIDFSILQMSANNRLPDLQNTAGAGKTRKTHVLTIRYI